MAKKKDLINSVKNKLTYLSYKDASYIVDLIFESIRYNLIHADRLEFRGFGSFSLRKRKYAKNEEEYNTIYFRMSKTRQSNKLIKNNTK